MADIVWEKISGFASLSEYHRFVLYVEAQVAAGVAKEIPVDQHYGRDEIFGGRWFQYIETGAVWRLIAPDIPFKGLWEQVQ